VIGRVPRYIEGTEVRLTVRDRIFLDAEFFDGTRLECLEPHRLFPVTGPSRYVALIDEEGESVGVIGNLDDLMEGSKEAVMGALDEYYMIPRIERIILREDRQGLNRWEVETNHGKAEFEMADVINSIKRLYDDRVLIKDLSDNRYEIPDLGKLDARSLKFIIPDL